MKNTSFKKEFITNNLIVLFVGLFLLFLLSGCTTKAPVNNKEPVSSGNVIDNTQDTDVKVNQTQRIDISNFAFVPADVTINQGDMVIWKNNDSVEHQISFMSGAIEVKSDLLKTGDEFGYKFDNSGVIDYNCPPHPGMMGKITIK